MATFTTTPQMTAYERDEAANRYLTEIEEIENGLVDDDVEDDNLEV